jgi:hypothetical protein
VPFPIAYVVSANKASMADLCGGTLGLEDLYDLIEIIQVDRHNEAAIERARSRA